MRVVLRVVRLRSKCCNIPSSVTIVSRQMLGNIGVETEVLDQVDEEGRGKSVSTKQADVMRLAGTIEDLGGGVNAIDAADVGNISDRLRLQLEGLDCFIDCILGHLAVSGPFTTSTCKQAGIRDRNQVTADQGLGVLRLGVSDEGTDTWEWKLVLTFER